MAHSVKIKNKRSFYNIRFTTYVLHGWHFELGERGDSVKYLPMSIMYITAHAGIRIGEYGRNWMRYVKQTKELE